MKIRLTNNSGLIKEADWGFSWKTLFFGLFVPLVRGDLAWFFIGFFLSICTAGIALLVFPFYYNKIYVKKLLVQGFYPLDEESRKTLVNAGIIRDQGTPPRVEPEVTKSVAEAPTPAETIGDAAVRTVPVAATSVPPVSAPEPNGWKCTSCETENLSEHNFCYSCGHEREKPKPVCPKCGKERQPGMRFCPYCGTALPDQGDTRGVEKRPENIPSPAVQDSPATSSHPCPVPAVPQSNEPKATPFPMGAIAVIALGVGILIAVFFSFSKGSPKVTISHDTIQETRSVEGASGELPGTSPESSVILFYNLISKGQYADAYELFSMNRKGRVLRDNFLNGFRNTLSTNVIGLEKYYQDNSFATVAIRVVSLDRSTTGGPDVKKAFQGEWTLVNVGGYWLLDKSNIKQVPVLPGE